VTIHPTQRFVVVLVGLAVSGCGRPDLENRPVAPTQVLDFEVLFPQNCAGCHGAEGRFGPAPPLNNPLFLAIIPGDELKRVAAEGRDGRLMPAFLHDRGGPLTQQQIELVVDGIRARWSRPADKFEPPPPPYLLSAASAGDKQAGARWFAQICARCHGEEGQGMRGQKGKAGPLHSAAFLGLISDQALRRIVITGRSDLGMPDYRKLGETRPGGRALDSREVSDIVAYLTSWRISAPPQAKTATAPSGGVEEP
jgi:mono/diheme cytochrome c family protein